jgi:hypothetical protein
MKFEADDIMATAVSSIENKPYWLQQKAKQQPTYFTKHVEEVKCITFLR